MSNGEQASGGRVLAAVVTYNRLSLLKRCIEALRQQASPAWAILVVDNSSTDGTEAWLAAQPDLKVIRQENSGSAGGLNSAAKFGYNLGVDWVWMMDDDTIPRVDTLERLLASPAAKRGDTGFVYSLQVYPDGTVPTNDPGPTGPEEWALTVLRDRCIPVKRCSFVSFMVTRRAIAKVGYPLKEMFFMCDDHEYTRRITEAGLRGYCVLDSVVLHDTKIPATYDVRSWSPVKKRYAVRNAVYLVKTSTDSLRRKAWILVRMAAVETLSLLRGRSSVGVLGWAFKGILFHPSIERPEGGIQE